MEEQYAGVGILTFHCSDNFGAMLQAYGLKQFLCRSGVRASLVPYAPPYMIGRHWRIPYVPCRKPGGPLTCAAYAASGLQKNFCAYREFSIRRANMRRFRTEHLVNDGQPAIHFPSGLRDLPYRCYVVGSDQIWNPEITFGLRPEYFGSFADKKKARVIAYAASLGGATLPPQYDRDFARLLQNLDAVSLREQEAAGYVKRFYDGEVAAVLDPVFLLDRESWTEVEKPPAKTGYILTASTEKSPAMTAYVQTLSQNTGLPVVQLCTPDDSSGPAEFLGYIHKADYVVTNSFHATAFSIIYEKNFLAFAHSRLNARIENILQLHGLEDRLCRDGSVAEIDAPVDWTMVREKSRAAAAKSVDFLLRHVTGGGL